MSWVLRAHTSLAVVWRLDRAGPSRGWEAFLDDPAGSGGEGSPRCCRRGRLPLTVTEAGALAGAVTDPGPDGDGREWRLRGSPYGAHGPPLRPAFRRPAGTRWAAT